MTFHQVQKLKLLNGWTYMYTRYVFHIVLDNFHFSMLTTFTFINWHLSLHMPIAFPFRLDNFHFKILTTFTLRPDNFHFKTLTTFPLRSWHLSLSDLTTFTFWPWHLSFCDFDPGTYLSPVESGPVTSPPHTVAGPSHWRSRTTGWWDWHHAWLEDKVILHTFHMFNKACTMIKSNHKITYNIKSKQGKCPSKWIHVINFWMIVLEADILSLLHIN